MFFAMDGMGLYGSEFFHFQSDDDATPAMILGVALKTKGQYWGVIAFFFFNSFFSVWNGIVIAPIFEGMVYDDNYDLEDWGGGIIAGKTVMLLYEIWRGGRSFFSLLGMTSNVAFFMATAGGALFGSLITKSAYSTEFGKKWLRHPNKDLKDAGIKRERARRSSQDYAQAAAVNRGGGGAMLDRADNTLDPTATNRLLNEDFNSIKMRSLGLR